MPFPRETSTFFPGTGIPPSIAYGAKKPANPEITNHATERVE
jgi:hypothetical protein